MPQDKQPNYEESNKIDLNESKKTKSDSDLILEDWKNDEEEDTEELEPWENENNPAWKNFLLFFADILLNAAIIITIVFTVRYFLISPFQVSGNSMLDNLHDKEYIIVNKLNYRINEPERGDTIVFLPPNHKSDYYVKRIIGVPGDTVIIENGKVKIKNKEDPNGHFLDESYLSERFQGKTYLPTDMMNETFTVPEEAYFVLGDNRTGSSDSRYWRDAYTNVPTPYVSEEMISGKVWVVLWPISEIRVIDGFFN